MVTKTAIDTKTLILNLVGAALLSLIITILVPARAHGIGNYNNYELVNHARKFVGGHGSEACKYTGQINLADGQCKTFVDCIIYAVSGRTQVTYPGYHEGFSRAGGQEISRNNTAIGDIIQVLPSSYGMIQHTAIISSINADGSFRVIDSNWDYDGTVRERASWKPAIDARFWRMGKTNQPIIGNLESIARVPGGIRAKGWAIDQDTPASIETHVYGGNGEINPQRNPGVPLLANIQRNDVANAYPKYGAKHGFNGIVGVTGNGNQRVCAYGINAPGTPGATTTIGCRSMTVSVDPFGYIDSIKRVSGGAEIKGWTIDPDIASSVTVHAYGNTGAPGVASNPFKSAVANLSRPDLLAHYPEYSDRHGYTITLPISSKTQTVCIYAINNTANSYNPQIGCKII